MNVLINPTANTNSRPNTNGASANAGNADVFYSLLSQAQNRLDAPSVTKTLEERSNANSAGSNNTATKPSNSANGTATNAERSKDTTSSTQTSTTDSASQSTSPTETSSDSDSTQVSTEEQPLDPALTGTLVDPQLLANLGPLTPATTVVDPTLQLPNASANALSGVNQRAFSQANERARFLRTNDTNPLTPNSNSAVDVSLLDSNASVGSDAPLDVRLLNPAGNTMPSTLGAAFDPSARAGFTTQVLGTQTAQDAALLGSEFLDPALSSTPGSALNLLTSSTMDGSALAVRQDGSFVLNPQQQAVLNANVHNHVTHQLSNMAGRNYETILHLNPQQLGSASVQIQWNSVDQTASIHIVVEKSHALAAVEQAVQGLKESLGQQGIKVAEVKTTQDPSAGQFAFHQNNDQQGTRQEFLQRQAHDSHKDFSSPKALEAVSQSAASTSVARSLGLPGRLDVTV